MKLALESFLEDLTGYSPAIFHIFTKIGLGNMRNSKFENFLGHLEIIDTFCNFI